MDIKQALKKLEESPNFKSWKQKHKGTYFSYAFKILQEMNPEEWQIGFYDSKKDKITTFIIDGDAVTIKPEEDIFKKEETKVNEVNLSKVKLTFDNVIAKSDNFQKENFPNDKSVKTIAILQNVSKLGNVWNITYVTEAFNTLNMKIDASNGKVLEHNLASIFSFRKE
ncbi:hypothetical protein HYW20_00805 [Candidatus Woesearchaeota archaeon]|nr:hypothetical protein [Candidatus Woesearchaeota archaeon]